MIMGFLCFSSTVEQTIWLHVGILKGKPNHFFTFERLQKLQNFQKASNKIFLQKKSKQIIFQVLEPLKILG